MLDKDDDRCIIRNMTTRTCKKCQNNYQLEDFPIARITNKEVYRRHICKSCYHKIKKSRKKLIKDNYLEIKKKLSCMNCGNNDFRVLEFDHIDRNTKSFNISDGLKRGYSLEKIRSEMTKCIVLCANCHRIKTYEENNRDVG